MLAAPAVVERVVRTEPLPDVTVLTEEQLGDVIHALEHLDGTLNPDWYAVGSALHGLGDLGHDLWVGWSERFPPHTRTPDEQWEYYEGHAQSPWQNLFKLAGKNPAYVNPAKGRRSFNPGAVFGRGDAAGHIDKLIADGDFNKAMKNLGAYDAAGHLTHEQVEALKAVALASADNSNDKRLLVDSFEKGRALAPAEFNANWEEQLLSLVAEMNLSMAKVMIGGNHRVMTEKGGDLKYIKLKELLEHKSQHLIQTGEKHNRDGTITAIYKSKIHAWANHHLAREYENVVFLPGEIAAPDIYNTWKGFTVNPMPGSVDAIKAHIYSVICNEDIELYNYVYKWFAWGFQNPGRLIGSALVWRGGQGVGKSIITDFLSKIWGEHSVKITADSQLTGRFNSVIANKCFVSVEEAFFSGDRKGANALKEIITGDNISIEYKGIEPISLTNCIKVIINTNEDHAINAQSDERRYCVCDISDRVKGNTAYFAELSGILRSKEGKAAFLYDMLNLDLTGFNPRVVPVTDALVEQKELSLAPHKEWFLMCLREGALVGGNNMFNSSPTWQTDIAPSAMHKLFCDYCNISKIDQYAKRASVNQLATWLTGIYGKPHKTKKANIYHLGTPEEAGRLFTLKERITV
jgi:hypothetical protein